MGYFQARFNLERKSWAERVERIEKIAADAKQDAKNAGDEVTRLQVVTKSPHCMRTEVLVRVCKARSGTVERL